MVKTGCFSTLFLKIKGKLARRWKRCTAHFRRVYWHGGEKIFWGWNDTIEWPKCAHAVYLHCVFVSPVCQIEEVEALSSIYGDEWCVIDEASRIFCIKISNDLEESKLTACLQVGKSNTLHVNYNPLVFLWLCHVSYTPLLIDQIILPPDYPSASPPIYQIK